MRCPTCGKTMLSEWPHLHALTRSQLDPDPLTVDPDPRVPLHLKPYRLVAGSKRRGCSVLPFLVLAVVAWRVG